jgi:hypothetical protein
VTGGPRTLGAPDKNDHKKFDSTFLGFLEKCFGFGGKYNIFGKFLGVSVKFVSYFGKIGVCPENFFDSQNGTQGGEVAEVEQRGAKSGRLTEGPQRLRYATGNKATDLDGRDNLYVHCVSKERLELLREGMSCVELEIML